MQRTKVKSSNIVSIGYDAAARTLEVEFDGGSVYQYYGVPPQVHAALMAASSHGSYLASHVKGKYRFKQVK